jgi:CTP:molybdopterin cytidylyltransferase MocA
MTAEHAVVGVLLAAGSGERFGGPKALVRDQGGTSWLVRTVQVLVTGGIDGVYVVVGAAADTVSREVPAAAEVVVARDWAEGMGASLRAGLDAVEAAEPDATALLVMLVDTPGVGPDVVRRLLSHAGPDRLARAAYQGQPGHPVLLGRDHWAGIRATAKGDRGARDYLQSHTVELVEVGDVGSGVDLDTVDAWRAWHATDGAT